MGLNSGPGTKEGDMQLLRIVGDRRPNHRLDPYLDGIRQAVPFFDK